MPAVRHIKFMVIQAGMKPLAQAWLAAWQGFLHSAGVVPPPMQIVVAPAAVTAKVAKPANAVHTDQVGDRVSAQLNDKADDKVAAVTIPLILYSQAATIVRQPWLAGLNSRCCVILQVPLTFPFLPALRYRAQTLLGDRQLIEMPRGAPSNRVAAMHTLAHHLQLLPVATERNPPAAASGQMPLSASSPPSAVSESASESAQFAQSTQSAGQALSLIAPLNMQRLAEMLDFPLIDMYHKLRTYLPASVACPEPLTESGESAYAKIQNMWRYAQTAQQDQHTALPPAEQSANGTVLMLYRLAAVCLLLLVARQDAGYQDNDANTAHRAAHTDKADTVEGSPTTGMQYLHEANQLIQPDDAEFMPLKAGIQLLIAARTPINQAQQAADWLTTAGLSAQLTAPGAPVLLYALLLRLWIAIDGVLAPRTAGQHTIARYQQVLPQLTADEREAIGATASHRLQQLRTTLGDIL